MTFGRPLAARRALFVSWIGHHGRSEDLAAALGAECAFVAVGRLTDRRTAPLRHLVQALRTLVLLARRRPEVLIVMAPPSTLVVLALMWRRLTRRKLVVDCHSKAVLGHPLSWRLAARADLALVTIPELTEGFSRVIAVHDPPATAVAAERHAEVVFPASWYDDEPIDALLCAAEQLPDVRFAITGRSPVGLQVPSNVRLTGYLPRADYLDLIAGAPLVLALTTRKATMQRAAYEAVAAGRPVVASETAALRSYLGAGAHYATPAALAPVVRGALASLPALEAAVARVRDEQRAAFFRALHEVGRVLA
ncbi:MAG: glycosyl transferase group 1 [Frankiales bacterium]|nr:glycosyl transferase group 1 [Frankiales bacterium]